MPLAVFLWGLSIMCAGYAGAAISWLFPADDNPGHDK